MPINMFAALTGDRPYRHPILDAMRKANRVEDIPYRGPTFVPTQAVADRLAQVYGGTPVEVLPKVLGMAHPCSDCPCPDTCGIRSRCVHPYGRPTAARTCTYCGRDGHGAPSCPWRPA